MAYLPIAVHSSVQKREAGDVIYSEIGFHRFRVTTEATYVNFG